ncbi:MAG: TetR/AcrR family transcriptional regulator [Burkholderiales bacterium]
MKTDAAKAPRTRGRPRGFDREQALERAMELFWRQGYESTSIADLTRAMGINPPSLYAAFGDKERLFLEAVERYGGHSGQTPESILSAAPSAREGVERLLDAAAREFTDPCHPPGCMVVSAATNCSAGAAHVQAALAARRRSAEAKLKARIAHGVKQGELPARTDCGALAKFYCTVIEGMSIQARDGASRKSLLATAAAALRAWPTKKANA